ncbi:helix-turn-helix transcriptional regulator [Actinomadura barringtoniae]|uniref:Helix-turn-helix transcriptional regulator n=1 Tax=Actinomadura barringtoniae TaxID=1427535 RepID=A0A939PFE8_9ACTN|nr:helix-turn-helix transcriptional regulator [Actinomadura barringtoniae]MBO2448724.1 helix-turn-helix transcriptional regulator [Actinomadura barringtoniae]
MGTRLGIVVRTARVGHGWTQAEAARRLHCSRSTLSRIETGARAVLDVDTLRRLAAVLGISPADLGITTTVTGEPPAEDDVRRRELLQSLAVTAAASAVPAHAAATRAHGEPGGLLVARIRDAMLGTGPRPTPISPERLRAALTSAVRDYDNAHLSRLAETLPRLLASGGDTLAETYNLTTRLLIKLDTELAWIAADRARGIAGSTGDPLAGGEAARNLAVLARRAGWYSQATQIALDTAENDALQGADPARTAERGLLVMSAAYTAAHAGDQAGMRELTRQAEALATQLHGATLLRHHGGGFSTAAVRLHLISAEYSAGDPSAAITAARRIRPGQLPTLERRARFYTDVARAYGMWGRRDACLHALLAAERAAPEETRARPAVRELVTGLLVAGRTTPDLRGLAARCRIS